jgi:hypothetical protein
VDLIVGLPGDTADDVARGVDFLEKHGLSDCAQVFSLYVLPGTAMRERAAEDGLIFEPDPPYRIIRTATMDEEAIATALREAGGRLGRNLDERPRPHLVESRPTGPVGDIFRLKLDHAGAAERVAAASPGAQHCALWFEAEDLYSRRFELLTAISARHAVDPYATLDVVLAPSQPFPLELLELVRARLAAAPACYTTRTLRHRGDGFQRVSVVLERTAELPADWIQAVMDEVPVFRNQSLRQAVADAARLGDELPAARIVGRASDGADFARLEAEADPECVVFADRDLEALWQRRVLGYGDAGS